MRTLVPFLVPGGLLVRRFVYPPVPLFPRSPPPMSEPVLLPAAPEYASWGVVLRFRLVPPQPPLLWSPSGFFVRSLPVPGFACAS